MVQKERIRKLNDKNNKYGQSVIYWMSREQRVKDNWAMLYAAQRAKDLNVSLIVAFVISSSFPGATLRTYDFMITGLKEVAKDLEKLNIPLLVEIGDPEKAILALIKKYETSILVTDFSPLKIGRKWRRGVAEKIDIPFYEVDSRNIVPIWEASSKLEFAAYTIRPKITAKLDVYLTTFPELQYQEKTEIKSDALSILDDFLLNFKGDRAVAPSQYFKAGEREAHKKLSQFVENILPNGYSIKRNDPTVNSISDLSPYLHFGQISSQRVALEAKNSNAPQEDKSSFLEELVVRRELADNYCFYNENYDNFNGFPDWAKQSLIEHKNDKRQYIYEKNILEEGRTHDPIWNAAQMEMVKTGKMHGYMRMYWAKKILEWTISPDKAMEIAVYLNDKYELDGRDPNGYVGCAWSIGGVHDRAWFDRPIFGKIRYMNDNGLRKKFDVEKYIEIVNSK
jgi:deoxyribodipyrimidine photo-lyase